MSEASLLLKNATLHDPLSHLNGSTSDLLIDNGIIVQIAADIEVDSNTRVVDCTGHLLSPAFFDLRCKIDEPGNEHKETIESLCQTAASGGFSGLAGMPSAQPVVQNKSSVQYLLERSKNQAVQIHPLGAATEDLAGNELTELFDMKQAGAVGFSNANNSYAKSNVLYKILMYASNFGMPVFSHAEDPHLAQDGMVNESGTTIHTGLKFRPAIAEFSRIQQEVEVARYANSPLHFSHISCKESVQIIRRAKADGLAITCDVSILHLSLTDEAVLDFDTNTKLLPPLRTEEDRQALIAGVKDGTIDAICSDHSPQNIEQKRVEFDYAAFGAIVLQTFYSCYCMYLHQDIDFNTFLTKTSISPRKIVGLDVPQLKEGKAAELALFDPENNWSLTRESNQSLSNNSPWWKKELKGKCKALFSNNQFLEF